MNFISVDDIKPLCPKLKQETLSVVVAQTERLFCGLLPLKPAKRKVKFSRDQVREANGRRWVETSLLNIGAATLNGEELEMEVDGNLGNALYFKGKISFDPLLVLEVKSWYSLEELPDELKDAMISYATEQALMTGQWVSSSVASYKMGPRTITFRENSPAKDQVMQTIRKYQI